MTKKFKGPDGTIIDIDDSMTEEDMGALWDQLSKNEAPEDRTFLGTAGNAFTREALRIPSRLFAEAPNFVRNALEWGIEGKPWAETTKAEDDPLLAPFSRKTTDEFYGKTLGLYDEKKPQGFWNRTADRAGGLSAGLLYPGALTSQGGKALLGALGGTTIGGEVVDEVLPEEYKGVGEAAGGLLGGAYGAYRGIKVPSTKVPTDIDLAKTLSRGIASKPGPIGPTPGPVPNTLQQASEAAKKIGLLEMTKQIDGVRDVGLLSNIKPKAPGLLNRTLGTVGLDSQKAAHQAAMYDSITRMEKMVQGLSPARQGLARRAMTAAADVAGRTTVGHKIGSYYVHARGFYQAMKDLVGQIGGGRSAADTAFEAELGRLERLIRVGKAIPETRGQTLRAGIRDTTQDIGSLAGAASRAASQRIGVDPGPGGRAGVRGSGVVPFKPETADFDWKIRDSGGRVVDAWDFFGKQSPEAQGAYYLSQHGSYAKAREYLEDAYGVIPDDQISKARAGLAMLEEQGYQPFGGTK